MVYKARCHCGCVRFSFNAPPIVRAVRCNCSLCARRGALLSAFYVPAGDFTPHDDPRDLSIYLWNEKVLQNYFCRHCGIFTYIGDGEDNRDGYRVNLGCIEGLDLAALTVGSIDGKSIPVVEQPKSPIGF